jgi:uncharacterized protein (UPF0303 family)
MAKVMSYAPSDTPRTIMDIATLTDQENRLVFASFDDVTALELGLELVDLAREGNLPVVINIRTPNRTLFHAAMPGSGPLNDHWASRKSATTLLFHSASLLVGAKMREKGEGLDRHGLSEAEYATAGGSFPIRVKGVGVVAAVTVSGLPQIEDHALVVRAIEAMLGA